MIIQYIFYLKQCTQHKGEKCENDCIRQPSWPIRDERNERCGCVFLFAFPLWQDDIKVRHLFCERCYWRIKGYVNRLNFPYESLSVLVSAALHSALTSHFWPALALTASVSSSRNRVWWKQCAGQSWGNFCCQPSFKFNQPSIGFHRFHYLFSCHQRRQAGRTSLVPFIKTIERQQLYTVFINQVGKRKGKSLLQHKVNAEFSGAVLLLGFIVWESFDRNAI